MAWQRAWSYKDHGKSWEAVHADHPPGFRWLHGSFGSNWRLTEMQAAIGRIQLRKLDTWLARRRGNATLLGDRLAGVPGLRVPMPPADAGAAYYKFYAFVRPEVLRPGWNRDAIVGRIIAYGGVCMHGGCSEIYQERAFDGSELRPVERLPVARRLGETSLMFLVDPTRTPEQMAALADVVVKVMQEAVLWRGRIRKRVPSVEPVLTATNSST